MGRSMNKEMCDMLTAQSRTAQGVALRLGRRGRVATPAQEGRQTRVGPAIGTAPVAATSLARSLLCRC